jgi:probable HAF family extracellular repeat protein
MAEEKRMPLLDRRRAHDRTSARWMSSGRRELGAIAAAVCAALAVASPLAGGAQAQQPAAAPSDQARSDDARSGQDHVTNSRKPGTKIGLRGHGFVRDASGAFSTIDVDGARSFTVVFGINSTGDTAGGYVDARGTLHGFLRRAGTITTIDFPGAKATFATRVNDLGQIVGAYSNDPNTPALELPHGFLLDNGAFTKIDVPGAAETRPFGINNAGQIVGEYVDTARRSHGFLFANGVYTTIDAPGGTSTWVTDIDDSGRMVGISFGGANATAGPVRGFLRDAQGAFTPIDAPAAPPPPGRPELLTTRPFGLNNRGQVTGVFTDSEGIHSFLMDNGQFTTIAVPDAVGSTLCARHQR